MLITRSAEEIATTVNIAIRQLQPDTRELPIVFQGGMFEHSPLYRKIVARCIRRMYPNPIKMAPYRTVLGAGLLAAATTEILPDRASLDMILQGITQRSSNEIDELSYEPWEFVE